MRNLVLYTGMVLLLLIMCYITFTIYTYLGLWYAIFFFAFRGGQDIIRLYPLYQTYFKRLTNQSIKYLYDQMQCESMRHREPCRLCQNRHRTGSHSWPSGCQRRFRLQGDAVTLNISVAADKADAASLTEGRRVAIDGVLRIKGAPEKRQYFNLSAETIELDPVAESGIGGEMEFRGTLCKDIVTPTDKKETASSASRHTPPTRSAMSFTVSLSASCVFQRQWSRFWFPREKSRQR